MLLSKEGEKQRFAEVDEFGRPVLKETHQVGFLGFKLEMLPGFDKSLFGFPVYWIFSDRRGAEGEEQAAEGRLRDLAALRGGLQLRRQQEGDGGGGQGGGQEEEGRGGGVGEDGEGEGQG